MNGVELIAAARARHPEKGYTNEHDDTHTNGELADAAICYAANIYSGLGGNRWGLVTTFSMDPNSRNVGFPTVWPWGDDEFHPTPEDRVNELAIAGGLIAAEIDRLQRLGTDEPICPTVAQGC